MTNPMRRILRGTGAAMLLGLAAACSPDRIVANASLPPNVPDPAVTKTTAGAIAAYYGALTTFNVAFAGRPNGGNVSAVAVSGLLSDELQAQNIGSPTGVVDDQMAIDSRVVPEFASLQLAQNNSGLGIYGQTYAALQQVRGQANEARGLLTHYAPDSLHALAGHLYAIQGYAEVLLGDLFCSGVPLSTLDFDGGYTLQPGSSTEDIYRNAIAMFDSALVAGADSERIVDLASVGKGRALLDLGDFAGAAQAVAAVPDGFTYDEDYPGPGVGSTGGTGTLATQNFAVLLPGSRLWEFTEADSEGRAGLDYRSSGDPRTAATALGTNGHGVTIYHPDKYSTTGNTPVVLADWIEARLIEAEAALQAGDTTTWLAKLNHLRETAISPALPDLADPGSAGARVDLTFRERAFWLFLTAHRQGDLRRLVREYGRSATDVFPTGPYRGANGSYGGDVTLPVPPAERQYNPRFTGCMSRGA